MERNSLSPPDIMHLESGHHPAMHCLCCCREVLTRDMHCQLQLATSNVWCEHGQCMLQLCVVGIDIAIVFQSRCKVLRSAGGKGGGSLITACTLLVSVFICKNARLHEYRWPFSRGYSLVGYMVNAMVKQRATRSRHTWAVSPTFSSPIFPATRHITEPYCQPLPYIVCGCRYGCTAMVPLLPNQTKATVDCCRLR